MHKEYNLRNSYSNFHRKKDQKTIINYCFADILIQKDKIKKIKERYDSFDDRLKAIADRHIKLCKQNIEFYYRQINQQILEKTSV